MLSHDLKCIFLHPEKTGGKSIESAIFGVEAALDSADHRYLDAYVQTEGAAILDYYKFIFARNPWARLVSYYFATIERTVPAEAPPKTRRELSRRSERFKKRSLRDVVLDGRVLRFLQPQVRWIEIDGTRQVDFVGRLEMMQAGFDEVCDRLSLPRQDVPHLNASQHQPYRTYYDDETRRIVGEAYREDVEFFGYSFQG